MRINSDQLRQGCMQGCGAQTGCILASCRIQVTTRRAILRQRGIVGQLTAKQRAISAVGVCSSQSLSSSLNRHNEKREIRKNGWGRMENVRRQWSCLQRYRWMSMISSLVKPYRWYLPYLMMFTPLLHQWQATGPVWFSLAASTRYNTMRRRVGDMGFLLIVVNG